MKREIQTHVHGARKNNKLFQACSLALATGLLSSGPAIGQDEFDTALQDWDAEGVYEGWSVEEMLDQAEVRGPEGEEIGSVENLIINDEGQIVAIIAQVGGFWDIGDTHIAVPWEDVSFDGFNAQIPVTEENVDDYNLFRDEYFTQADVGDLETVEDDLDTGFSMWKATQLVNDYAVLENGIGYGYVDDLIFNDEGMLQSIIVNATNYADPGYYAYPWFGTGYTGYAWDPALDYYTLPFGEDEIIEYDTVFDYDRLDDGVS